MESLPNCQTEAPLSDVFRELATQALDFKASAAYRWEAMNAFLDLVCPFFEHEPYNEKQREACWRFINREKKFAWIACRGASKGEMFLLGCVIVCLGEPGTPGRWLSGDTDQLEEVQDKAERLVDVMGYTLGKSAIAHQFEVRFDNGSVIDFNPTTKTSGRRRFLIVRDEGGKIFAKDAIKRFKEADGMLRGTWKFSKRDRLCSTPSTGSAFDGIDDILEEQGHALRHDYHSFSWVSEDIEEAAIIEMYGEAFLNCEYKCVKDAPGGRMVHYWKQDVDDFKPVDSDYCIIGTDWNGGWGHAGLCVFYRPGERFHAHDEYKSLAIRPPVAANDKAITDKSGLAMNQWMAKCKAMVVPGHFMVISEVQGLNYTRDLELLGIKPVIPEEWGGMIQRARIPLTVSKLQNEEILVGKRCTQLMAQLGSVHWGENGDVPKQVDHHFDCLHHVMAFKKPMDANKIPAWVH